MPLLDHFHPPLSLARQWDGFHSAWASTIAQRLNQNLLPPDYFALPLVTVGVRIEADVGSFASDSSGEDGGVATKVWAPAAPPLTAPVAWSGLDSFEVQVLRQLGGTKLRAAVELVSPANKDRASHRRAFAVNCASYLQQGVSVVVVDVVTERIANLHANLVGLLDLADGLRWQSDTDLYAVAYRPVAAGEPRLEVWSRVMAVGSPLPTLSLWLDEDLSVPLNLEESYAATCAAVRIRT